MIRTVVIVGICVAVLGYAGWIAYMVMTTRAYSPEETIIYNDEETKFTITYCRPYKKGRRIFGGLVPHGEYWRTGANDATEISFSRAVDFGGKKVDAGQYRLYTTPDVNSWQVVLNTELNQWGAFIPNKELDIAVVTAPVRSLPKLVEQFTIFFDNISGQQGYNMHFQWDKTEVIIPIK